VTVQRIQPNPSQVLLRYSTRGDIVLGVPCRFQNLPSDCDWMSGYKVKVRLCRLKSVRERPHTREYKIHSCRLIGIVGPSVNRASLDANIAGFHVHPSSFIEVTLGGIGLEIVVHAIRNA
jgi:hypothetical protein